MSYTFFPTPLNPYGDGGSGCSIETKKVKKVKKLVLVETLEEQEPDDCWYSDDGKHNLDEFGHCIRCCECKKCIKILEEILDEEEEDDEDIDVCGETGREFDLRNPVKGCGKKLPDECENIMIGNISFCEDCANSPEGQKYMDDEDAANAE